MKKVDSIAFKQGKFDSLLNFFGKNNNLPTQKPVRFKELIKFFQFQKSLTESRKGIRPLFFDKVMNEIGQLKDSTLIERCKELQSLINSMPDKIRISAFELMEHNFRENTHSNILRYLFDYRTMGEFSIIALKNVLKATSGSIQHKLIEQQNYQVLREYKTENGRIDLLIIDKRNKFLIVIENKVLAPIGIIETDENITRTQLDEYRDFVNIKYSGYSKQFILLSFNKIDSLYAPYESLSYSDLYDCVKEVPTTDSIACDYKLLLQSMLYQIPNKEILHWNAKKIAAGMFDGISLTDIENINKFYIHE